MPAKKRKTTKRKTVRKAAPVRKQTSKSAICLGGNCFVNPVSLGLAIGVLWGLYMLVLGLLVKEGIYTVWVSPEIYDILVTAYPGFEATSNGSVIGLIWGLIDGFIIGLLIGLLYNFFQKRVTCGK